MFAGEEWRGRPRLAATVRLFSAAFFRKVIARHDTGMGESYMDGDWEVRMYRSTSDMHRQTRHKQLQPRGDNAAMTLVKYEAQCTRLSRLQVWQRSTPLAKDGPSSSKMIAIGQVHSPTEVTQHSVRQVDDLGGLLAVVCANARSIEAKRGMLGLLNWAGSKLLTLAHRRLASRHIPIHAT